MLTSALCVCIGQLIWKLYGDNRAFFIIIGFVFYGVGALFMLKAYRYGKLSVLQPMQSISYILSILLGYFVLKESVTILKFAGIIIIIIGVTLIAGDGEK
jgi:undecaprenyl phosphate-alpha-L-ara4N flippase subunit ArnE